MSKYLSCPSFRLGFAYDGKPLSFKLVDGTELLNTSSPGEGFVISSPTGIKFPLRHIEVKGDLLTASTGAGTSIVFRIHSSEKHIAFHVEKLIGLPIDSRYYFYLEINALNDVGVVEHNFMTVVEKSDNRLKVVWYVPHQRKSGDFLGGFSLYYKQDDEDEDDILCRIWAEEEIVHPKVNGEWTAEKARQWINRVLDEFPMSTYLCSYYASLGIEAKTLQEVYDAAEYAQKGELFSIYLMPWIWRDGFWPIYLPQDGVNTNVFPKGKQDIKDYSKYLESKGLRLQLHNVCGGIGFNDPCYVRPVIDDRLASWGKGRLARPISKEDTMIYFIPDRGVELPLRQETWQQLDPLSRETNVFYPFHNYNIIRIENELLKVGSFRDTDTGMWILEDCIRGYGEKMTDGIYELTEEQKKRCSNTVTGHDEGVRIVGLISTYEINLLPDNHSTLLEEQAQRYADVLNDYNVANVCYDGFEIHDFGGVGYNEKFAEEVYRRTDHPVSVISSNGRWPRCYLEYRFNCIKKRVAPMGEFKWGVHADLRLHRDSWIASNSLMAHWMLSQPVSYGQSNLAIRDHHNGVTLDILKRHGQSEEIIDIVRMWKELSLYLTDEIRLYLRRTEDPPLHLKLSGHHPVSDIVHVLTRHEDHFKLTPTKVMIREKGDIRWLYGQEHGCVPPYQYIKPGDTLSLISEYSLQEPGFILRILHETDYESSENLDVLSYIKDVKNLTDTEFLFNDGVIRLTAENRRSEDMWNEDRLPSWDIIEGISISENTGMWDGISLVEGGNTFIDMSAHRSVGMIIEGDSSGSIIVFQIPGRDYVFTVDFSGKKYVEIPIGEAAWSDGNWGWRMGTWKWSDYSCVHKMCLGFGKLPANTSSNVKVLGLKALKERPTKLVNPVIHIGCGSLAIKGEIRNDRYIHYTGGDIVDIFDLNWNLLYKLPVEKRDFEAIQGAQQVSITAEGECIPWMEIQFTTHGDSVTVPIR